MANEIKPIGWGRCSVNDSELGTYDDIVENSTQLTVQEGSEQEAKIEGGSAEGRKKQPDIYQLVYNRRIGDASEVRDHIGFKENVATVQVTPENQDAVGCILKNASRSVTVKFDTTDGLVAVYTYKTKGATDANGKLTDIELT